MELETDHKYQEILRLDKMLSEAYIPHELVKLYDGWQIIYPYKKIWEWPNGKIWTSILDAIEHFGSWGQSCDKLEIMGLLTDEEEKQHGGVLGNLTAEEVFERIKTHYESNKGVN